MFVWKILAEKQPEVVQVLCEIFCVELRENEGDPGYFDASWEMTHDGEGRYMRYSSRGLKV